MALEIPGGMVDPGESPELAASRELVEETGYQCSSLTYLGRVRSNPALFDNYTYTYLAKGLKKVCSDSDSTDNQGFEQDKTEHIEVIEVEAEEIPNIVKTEGITHALVLAAFYHFYVTHNSNS